MKIVCDNCATKYSIADEKVQGKVFKIKCKKCSHIIVVRGGAQGDMQAGATSPDPGYEDPQNTVANGAALTPSLAGAPGTDSIWHLVVDREQVGPLTPAEVRAKFASGQVDVETYAWREGFGDWLRLGSIDDFKDLAASAPARTEATARTDSSDLFGSASDDSSQPVPAADPSDLFGSAPATTAEASLPLPSPAASSANSGGDDLFSGSSGGGLFGAPSAEPLAAAAPQSSSRRTASPALGVPSGAVQQAASTSGSGEQKMTGQRNENSVLFSLNNLQALASGPSSAAPVAAQAAAPNAPRPGYADQASGGSGLIDIRAMASTLSASSGSSSGMGKSDDLPSFSAAPVFSPMAAPIMMPAQPSGMPKWMWAVIGLGVVAVLGIVSVGVILLTRKPEPAVVAAASPAPVAVAANTHTGTAPSAAPIPTQPVAAADTPKPAEASKGEPKDDGKHSKHDKGDKPGKVAKADTGSKPAMTGFVPPPTESKPAAKKGKTDAIDDLLNSASPAEKPSKRAAAPAEAAEDPNLPAQLGKSDIVGVMSGKVKPRVGGCFDQFKQPGMANVHLSIAPTGKVASATVNGKFAGTPTGACVEKAVKSAGFPRFRGPAQTIDYPFLLQ